MKYLSGHIKYYCSIINRAGICGWLLIAYPVLRLFFSRGRDLSEYATVDASAMIFILYSVICFFFSTKEILKKGAKFSRYLIVKTPLFFFSIYTLLGIVSMIWSVNYQLTGFRAFECFAFFFLIAAIMQKLFGTHDLPLIRKWITFYVVTEIILSILRRLIWTSNISVILQASQSTATIFFYLSLYAQNKKWYHYLILVMAIFSMSTVSYIGMALGLVSVFWCKKKYRVPVFLGTIALVFIVGIVGPYNFIKDTVFFDKESISIQETTGRDKVMMAAINALPGKPEGYGFFSGEPYLLYSQGLYGINGHNSLISAAMGLGIPGIILLSIFFIAMFHKTFSKYITSSEKPVLIGCFIVAFIQCMGNPSVGSRVYGAWIPEMVTFCLICSHYIYGRYYTKVQQHFTPKD